MAIILVVDDNAAIARMLARFLESKGYHAIIACSGAEALVAAAARPAPDLILLDLCMPEMDGIEVLRQLKRNSMNITSDTTERAGSIHAHVSKQVTPSDAAGNVAPALPVILFSAVDDPAVIAAAYQYGACDYWVKASFRFDDLPKAIEQHLARFNT